MQFSGDHRPYRDPRFRYDVQADDLSPFGPEPPPQQFVRASFIARSSTRYQLLTNIKIWMRVTAQAERS
jgi:hypothetical protein